MRNDGPPQSRDPKGPAARPGAADSQGWTMPRTATRPALLPDGSDAELRRLVYGLFTISVGLDRLREDMAAMLGLSGIQYHILMVAAEPGAHGRVTISTVAETLHASGAHITTETGKLVASGLIEKRPNPADGRSVILAPTQAGHDLIDGFAASLRDINDTLFGGIGPETFKQFGAIVDHMVGTTEDATETAERLAKARAAESSPEIAAAVER